MIPIGYREMCSRLQKDTEILCRKIEKPNKVVTELNEITLNVLNGINTSVNRLKTGEIDRSTFNKSEHWDTNVYRLKGDCEEYVRMKYAFLLQNGFQPESLSPAFVLNKEQNMEGHLVLLVTLIYDKKPATLVLDNLSSLDNQSSEVLPINDAKYLEFVSVLKGDRSGWFKIEITGN